MNSSGKVLVIFLVITAILLVSLTAVSLFFVQKETEGRKLAEVSLNEVTDEKIKLEEDIKIMKKQNFLLQEKNKESDERVNDLSDELELEKGLREEMKLETTALEKKLEEMELTKKSFDENVEKKEKLHEQLTNDLEISTQKIKELEAQLKTEIERGQKLGKLYEEKQKEEVARKAEAEKSAKEVSEAERQATADNASENVISLGVELGEIVIAPGNMEEEYVDSSFLSDDTFSVLDAALDGRILSVDAETEFVIVSLGARDGLSVGNVLAVYRNDNYIGDIKVTRLQPEMSAADLILPFSVKNVRKNDHVKVK